MIPDAGDIGMNEISLLSWMHGLVEKTKKFITKSNIVWYDKCYARRMIKYNVSTDGTINSVEKEGQAILWVCMGNAIFKASSTHYYQMIILESWHKPISEKCCTL